MKKLLKFMACALAVSFGLTACDNGEDPHHPFDSGYKPKGSQLNTSHKLVGQMYGVDGVVEKNEDAQGIVFAVSKDGKTAYLVAFTDAMVVGADNANEKDSYCYTRSEGYFSPVQVWGTTLASHRDTIVKEKTENGETVMDTTIETSAVIHDVDGEINTAQILALFAAAVEKDSTYKLPSSYAAKICHDYYRREWSKKKLDTADNDKIGLKWKHTQGEWYLPSIEELGDLMKNKDKINKKYGNTPSDVVNENFFMPIGGEKNHAYWSSSEFMVRTAWYCLPEEVQGKNGKNEVYPGNRRYGYYQKNDRTGIHVRPIRKAPIK